MSLNVTGRPELAASGFRVTLPALVAIRIIRNVFFLIEGVREIFLDYKTEPPTCTLHLFHISIVKSYSS